MGRYLEAGETFCIVGPASDFDILVPLTEQEARFIKRGAPVVLKVTALPQDDLPWRDHPGAACGDRRRPAGFPHRPAGRRCRDDDRQGRQGKALEHQWYAQVKIVESSHLLRPGMTGRVKVKCGMQTVGRVLGQKSSTPSISTTASEAGMQRSRLACWRGSGVCLQ